MQSPLISICIPTYNGEKFLSACLDSAIGQTYKNIEIIIIDDCSTDNTFDIISKYAAKDPRIKLFQNEKNLGLVPNWNKCLEKSGGEWVKFLFQDDYLEINCLEQTLSSVSIEDRMMVSKRTYILDDSINSSTHRYYKKELMTFEKLGFKSDASIFIEPDKISLLAVQNICINFIGEPTVVLFRKNVIAEIGTFNQDLIQLCDLEYFLRMATRYGLKYIPQKLTYFRIHAESTSSSNIANRSFLMRHKETVITSYQLLYAKVFDRFRSRIPVFKKYKLKLFFLMHVYEFNEAAQASTPQHLQEFQDVCKRYPMIDKHKKGSVFIRFVFWMARMRRNVKTN